MFCPKCGKALDADSSICDLCGYFISEHVNMKAEDNHLAVEGNNIRHTPKYSKYIRFAYFTLSIVILVISFIAANDVAKGGLDISGIQSVGGKTLEEAFYQYSLLDTQVL